MIQFFQHSTKGLILVLLTLMSLHVDARIFYQEVPAEKEINVADNDPSFFVVNYGTGHWIDTLLSEVRATAYLTDSSFYDVRKEILDLVEAIERSSADSAVKAQAYKYSYRLFDKKEELEDYKAMVLKLRDWSPADSLHSKWYANYTMGNAFVLNDSFDSAAFYLSLAYDYDLKTDVGIYEGGVYDRVALIFHKLKAYGRSLEFSKLALEKSTSDILKPAVFNQMANNYVMLEDYQGASNCYDSATAYYQKVDNPNWWIPLFNSLTTHLQMRDSARFIKAYTSLKEVPRLREYDTFFHLIDLAKAEFSLTEWQRGSKKSSSPYGELVLERTPENEYWVRDVLESQIEFTEDEWIEQRDSYRLLLRWYKVCRPDSAWVAYERALALDRSFEAELELEIENNEETTLEAVGVEELQKLVAKIGYDILREKMQDTSQVKTTLRRESQNAFVYLGLILIAGFGAVQSQIRRRKRLISISELKYLKEREERLLANLLPPSQLEAIKTTGSTVAETYENTIVLVADFQGFTAFTETLSPVELITTLEEFFDKFELDCTYFGLEKLKTDGDSFVAIGGVNGDFVSPRQALNAALAMQRSAKKVNEGLVKYGLQMGLRIGLHVGTSDGGVLGNTLVSYDMWGEVFTEAKLYETHCPAGAVFTSKEFLGSEVNPTSWPTHHPYTAGGMEGYLFND